MVKLKLNFSGKQWGKELYDALGFRTKAFVYSFGTIEGIYTETEDGGIDIIAVDNLEPHNGHFDLFLDALERYKERTGKRIAICAFLNQRLYWHIRKREGWGNCFSTMDRLEYYGKQKEGKNDNRIQRTGRQDGVLV